MTQDKIHLLMEETGCDQGQAELAMTSAGYDLEKAIRTIGTLLRNIVVVKGKFHLPGKNLYGLVIFIADTRRQIFLRMRAVVSYNPALFETSLEEDWYDFERSLYAFRLWEGTLQRATQELERVFLERMGTGEGGALPDLLRDGRMDLLRERFERVVGGYFSEPAFTLELLREVLNLDQFRRLKSKEDDASPSAWISRPPDGGAGGTLLLNVDLEQDASGLPAREVQVGDSVYVLLTDGRDIAQYLSKLLGGRGEKGLKPMLVPVEEIREEEGVMRIQTRLSTGILGLAHVAPDNPLKIQRRAPLSWWRRWVPFWGANSL